MQQPLSVAVPSSVVRFLYTHNPFYLVGTLLVLYGAQQSLGQQPNLATSKLLMELLAGYTIVLAAVAVLIIRCGRIWDDARTILLVIVLLFFMLSTSMDFHFLFTLDEPWPGTWLLLAGWAFSIVISEMLLLVLGIRLRTNYRLAYHLILALLFVYPMLLGWMNYHSYYGSLPWALVAFPVAGASALLTLLPAAGTPRHREPKTGTPWQWPYYPWSLFFFLTIGIGIRAWWLTISFQPAKESYTIFGLYFLLPLVLAWAALVLEMGIARQSTVAVAAGMVLPLVGLTWAFPGPGQSPTGIEFLSQLSANLGSPPRLTVWALSGFYGWAWLRHVRASEGFLVAVALLASVVGTETQGLDSLITPQPLILAAIAAALIGRAVYLDSTWRAAMGAALAIATIHFGGAAFIPNTWVGQAAWFWQWHAPAVAIVAIPAVFNDRTAETLREIAWPFVPGLATVAALFYPGLLPQLPELHLVAYGALLSSVSFALWIKRRQVGSLAAALVTFGVSPLAYLRSLVLLLRQTPLAVGLPWLASGLAMVLLALAISFVKMGLWQRAWQWVQQVNTSLNPQPFKGVED
jgi:hypothetical protein